MTEEQLQTLERLASAATPGPWHHYGSDTYGWVGHDEDGQTLRVAQIESGNPADDEFVAAAREAVPALRAEVLRLTRERDEALAEVERLTRERDEARAALEAAVNLLAGWCRAIDKNGASWDYWDDYYKQARWGKGPLRSLIDAEIVKLGGEP